MPWRLNLYFTRLMLSRVISSIILISFGAFLIELWQTFNKSFSKVKPDGIELVMLAALRTPDHAQNLMPLIVLIGSVMFFVHLTKTNQLLMARQSGTPTLKLLTAPALTMLLIGLINMGLLNPIAAKGVRSYQNFIHEGLDEQEGLLSVAETGIWLRKKTGTLLMIIHADSINTQAATIQNVSVFEFHDNNLLRRIEAGEAEIHQGHWTMRDVSVFPTNGQEQKAPDFYLRIDFGPEKSQNSFTSIAALSIWQLNSFIQAVENAGFTPSQHLSQLHHILSTPWVIMAMFFLAGAICARTSTRRRATIPIFITLVIGFSYFVFARTFQTFGVFYEWPAILTIWMPHILLLFAAFIYMLYQDSFLH